MSRKTILNALTASALFLNAVAPLPANAGEGIFTIPLGENTDLCVGGWSCLFSEAPNDDRDEDGAADHRTGGGDGAGDTGGGTERLPNPQVRDHRSNPVRDHRAPRPNEVVDASGSKLTCRDGRLMLRDLGYRGITANDCEGVEYHYTARNGGSLYRAAFKAYSGDLTVSFIGLAN